MNSQRTNKADIATTIMPLEDIRTNRPHLRLDVTQDLSIHELVTSIQSQGLIHPLVVTSENELVAGARRYMALKALGLTEVRVSVLHELDNNKLEMVSIDENLERKSLSHVEMDKALARRKEIYELLHPGTKHGQGNAKKKYKNSKLKSFARDTSEKTGVSERTVQQSSKRGKLPPVIQQARENGEISNGIADELTRITDPLEQENILPMVINKTVEQARNVIRYELKSKKPNESENEAAESRESDLKQIRTRFKQLTKDLKCRLNFYQRASAELCPEATKLKNILEEICAKAENQ